MINFRVACVIAACAASAFFSGCGKSGKGKLKVVPVKGTVQLDGKSYGPGKLTLTPIDGAKDGRSTVSGDIAADGSFTLTTYNQGDGAPAGAYTVTLGSGTAASGSTDPAEMMAAAGGGSLAEPIKVTIPEAGNTALELKFTGSKTKRKANAPLGSPPM